MHDDSVIRLKKLDRDYDPRDRAQAMRLLDEAHEKQEFITGLIYINRSVRRCQSLSDCRRRRWHACQRASFAPRARRWRRSWTA